MVPWLADVPVLAIAGLFVLALARGQATYWLARLAVSGAAGNSAEVAPWRRRVRGWLDSSSVARARAAFGRWGLILITLCYFTIGFQTVALITAGALRIGWPRFTLAQLPGALAWALIYSTIGLAAFEGIVGTAVTSPVAWATLAGIAIIAVSTWAFRRAGLRRQRDED